jgi:outer membrane murein-binding lipoprotein Lpp
LTFSQYEYIRTHQDKLAAMHFEYSKQYFDESKISKQLDELKKQQKKISTGFHPFKKIILNSNIKSLEAKHSKVSNQMVASREQMRGAALETDPAYVIAKEKQALFFINNKMSHINFNTKATEEQKIEYANILIDIEHAKFNAEVRMGYKENSIQKINEQINKVADNVKRLFPQNTPESKQIIDGLIKQHASNLTPSMNLLNRDYLIKNKDKHINDHERKYQVNVSTGQIESKPGFDEFVEYKNKLIEEKDLESKKVSIARSEIVSQSIKRNKTLNENIDKISNELEELESQHKIMKPEAEISELKSKLEPIETRINFFNKYYETKVMPFQKLYADADAKNLSPSAISNAGNLKGQYLTYKKKYDEMIRDGYTNPMTNEKITYPTDKEFAEYEKVKAELEAKKNEQL